MISYSNRTYDLLCIFVWLFSFITLQAQNPPKVPAKADSIKVVQQKVDTTKTDTIRPALRYPFSSAQKGSLFLNELRKMEVVYDPVRQQYIFLEKIGNYYIEHPFYMNKEEYKKYRLQKDIAEYFKEKSTAFSSQKNKDEAQKNLLPKYYVRSEFFENIFGGNEIEVNPQGSVLVRMGILYQKVENPQLSERNRSSTTFDFDQEISASLTAKVGKRLRVNAAFDTQSTFDFQNQIKLEYTPTEDDIIRKIEVGNVNMPIQSSLISGAQNLFGVKTQLQFGKTTITGVFSQQRSQTRSVQAQGGATINEFELRASNYDENRHFFLAQQFRDDYNDALARLPLINSSKFITRIEVWITNRNNTTEDVRNIVALADLGETNEDKYTLGANINADPEPNPGPRNGANNLDELLIAGGEIRNISSVDQALGANLSDPDSYDLTQGTGYSILENARKLTLDVDFTLNPQLGYITLNRQLADSDILAVAYEYTDTNRSNPDNPDNPSVFRVGELSGDGVIAPDNLVVKLLRSEILNPALPVFDLMMKNVYALPGAFQLQQDGFRLEVLYQDDETGVPINFIQNAQSVVAGQAVSELPLLNLLRLDVLDGSNAPVDQGDGYFDFIEGITIDSQNGYVIFPSVEPFGGRDDPTSTNPLDSGELGEILTDTADDRFVFEELYDRTRVQAQTEFQNKDKYFLKGYFKSESRNGISLGAFNIPRGSVTVTSGGRELLEGVDYVVDYQIGTVQIINPNLIASNAPINATVENNTGFNQQRRRFMGLDVQHIFNENFAVGGTIINLNERPFTQKPQFGAEPVNNTMVGFNLNYQTEVPAFTKWVNKLPNIDTDAESNFSIRAEAAYLFPGSPRGIDLNGEAASYVDDFEGSQIPLDISSPRQWFLASTPENNDLAPTDPLNFRNEAVPEDLYREEDGTLNDDRRLKLQVGAERSQLAWYSIDRLFYGSQLKPSNIDDNELSRAEVRRVNFEELFPQLQLDVTQPNIVNTFDLAYYPQERGSYNFNQEATIANNSYSDNPEDKWAGIMRSLTTTDFQQANIEYIQFWLLDPYTNYSITPEEGAPTNINQADFGGELYFNLGNVSEDILDDNRRMFENGLPADGNKIDGVNVTDEFYSFIPINQSLIYAFTEEDSERPNQDVGLDGRNNEEEAAKFSSAFGDDPSNDDFQFFRGSALDAADAGILQRYKRFNNTQGNSPTINNSTESFPTSATSFPDIEDINQDQTMSDIESYYQYKISLFPNDLDINRLSTPDNPNYIVDQKEEQITLANGQTQIAKWYQFRIPITTGTPIGGISGFNAIRFIRMYLTKFKVPVVLRFGELELIRGDWRRYLFTINDNNPLDPPVALDPDQDQEFEVGVVNIQENEDKQPFPYVLPPGVQRERLQGSTTVQEQNEQSLLVKVNNLEPGETRAVFKNTQFDMRMFKNLRMFVHAESVSGLPATGDSELTAILRLGSDINDNFYQLEIPLRITKDGEVSADSIWKNDFDVRLRELGKLKLERQNIGFPGVEIFPSLADQPNARVRVKGSPNLSNIRTLMIGVRNDALNDKTAELWFNELRVSDFDNEGGWAAVVNADANFADFADISIAGRANSQGFGSIDQRPNERSQEDVKQYDIVTNVNLGQLLPKKAGIKIPLNYSISEEFRDPRWDPQFQDVLFEDAEELNANSENSRDYTKRRSINLINVRKERTDPEKKQRFYDIENFSASYSFNETYQRNYNIKKALDQNLRASATYNHSFKPFVLEPLKNWKFLKKGSYLKFLNELNINLLPSSISVNSNIVRSFNEQEARSLVEGLPELDPLTQRRYFFDWDYNIAYNLTKSLQFTFRATNNYIYDRFETDTGGEIVNAGLFNNFFKIDRPNNYHQTLDANYKIPINKIPIFDFVDATYRYTADYDWQAPAQSFTEQIGNTIQNANTHSLTANLNMTKFYKKSGLRDLGIKKKRVKKNKKQKKDKTKANLPPTPSIGNRRTTQRGLINKKNWSTGQKMIQGLVDVVTSVKNIRVSYSENNGTILPGYRPEIGFLGRDNFDGSVAPTLGFVFGSQRDIRDLALTNNWLVTRDIDSIGFSRTYSNTNFRKLDINADLKPFKNFNIELSANRVFTRNQSQLIDPIRFSPDSVSLNTSPLNESGNFSISYFMLPNAFDGNGDSTFEKFKENRAIIQQRLVQETGLLESGFGENSPEVLLPAFLAAYSGKSATKIKTGAFRNIPIPNWRINYKGLMQFAWFKKHFRSFNIDHRYNSTYSIIGFTNNLLYTPENRLTNLDINGNYQPEKLFNGINLVEEFNPLIRVDMKMRNNFSLRAEVRRDKSLNLNLNNNTITEIRGKEYVFGLGYRFKDVKWTIKTGPTTTRFKGDINLKADIGIRDNSTVIRSIDIDNNQVTGGQRLLSIKFNADWNLNQSLLASFFYDQNSSRFLISNTFPRNSINAGITLRYTIGN